MIKYILVLTLLALTIGCETTSPSGEAQQLTLSELTSAPGYAWFPAEMNSYTPRAEMIDSVNQRFDNSSHKIYVFVKPSCSCRGTQKLFPQIIKTLEASNVDMNRVEIWSMRYPTDSHPHSGKVSISDLPSVFVIKNEAVLHEINDGDYDLTNADALIANALIP